MHSIPTTARTVGSDWCFLLQTARRCNGMLIGDTLGTVVGVSMLHAAQLTAAPIVIGVLENGWSLWLSVMTACAVTAILCVLTVMERMVNDRFEQSRDAFRTRGCTMLACRAAAHVGTDAMYTQRLRVAYDAMGKHIHAPIPHLWYTLAHLMIHLIGLALTTVVLVRVHVLTAIVAAVTALIGATVHRAVTVLGARDDTAEATGDARLDLLTETACSDVYAKDIRVFGLHNWIRDVYDRTLTTVQAIAYRRAKIYAWFSAADALLTAVRGAMVLAMTLEMMAADSWSLSWWLLWVLCVGGCAQSIGGLLTNGAALRREWPSLTAYRRCLEEPDAFVTDGGVLPMAGALHTLELRHISVADPDGGRPFLHDVTLTLHEGERLAVVGEEGAWKSALAAVLCGLSDPTDGAVLLDGVDVRTLDRRAYYALLSTVFPNDALPAMTVREMLSTAAETVDETTLWGFLSCVGLDVTVRAWPRGLDTPVGQATEDSVMVSGGEKTRLLLARALCKNGDLLILDEPTAALDPLAEYALYQQYDGLTAGKGAIFLSHRAALSRCCDRIVYIKNGMVVEEGMHEELLARGGDYAALFELQSRYYREGRDPAWR